MNVTFEDKIGRTWTFLHVPKTAGKSISAYLTKYGKNVRTLHETSHATIKDMEDIDADLGTTFAVFRNPYSRAVSLYRFLFEVDIEEASKTFLDYFHKKPDFTWHSNLKKNFGKMSFVDFCRQLPYMPLGIEQHHFLPVGKKIRFEHFDEDSKFLHSLLDVQEPVFKFNSTGEYHWQSYYNNNDAQEIIYETYRKDFELLKYSKDINSSI
jgi:hypothetical protein